MRKNKIVSIQLIATLSIFTLLLSISQAEVTLTIGDGSGPPGSTGSQVTVSLDNPDDKVKGVMVDVCDVDNYLSLAPDDPPTTISCETTERTSGFTCSAEEKENGCCRVLMFSLGSDSIEEGAGPVFTITYDVLGEAPASECRDLSPEEVQIVDETGEIPSEDVITEPGEFCFSASSTTTTITTTTTTTTNTPSISISPDPMWKSRWISLPYLMVIIGNNTHFKCFNSRLSFEPPLMLFPCFPIVWDEIHIWNFIWVMPGWLAGLEDKTVTVTVTTGDEVVADDLEIKLLPFLLDQSRIRK